MQDKNEMKIAFPSFSSNESFARAAISAFVAQLDPTVDELTDIKTAVSEAVTNCIIHAYRDRIGMIYITVTIDPAGEVTVRIRDKGCGIEDVPKAMEPLFTTGGSERAGLGFAGMQSFMNRVRVHSKPGIGTTVTLKKKIQRRRIGA